MNPKTMIRVERRIFDYWGALVDFYTELGKLESEPFAPLSLDEFMKKGRDMLEKIDCLPKEIEGRYAAAVKRASMDLTRALTDLRQGR